MVADVIAATKLEDLMTPNRRGERVNVHVVSVPREPRPDFDEMRKVIQGRQGIMAPIHDDSSQKREISKND
jgi:hypothetical protein